jgi:hypothetical protein
MNPWYLNCKRLAWDVLIPFKISCTFTGEKTVNTCHCSWPWWFEMIGKFLSKSHRSAKSPHPHRMCIQALKWKWDCVNFQSLGYSQNLIFILKAHIHMRFGPGSFDVWWDLNRKFPIVSNCLRFSSLATAVGVTMVKLVHKLDGKSFGYT